MRRRELIVVRRLSSHFPRPRLRTSPSCWSGYYERRPTSVLIITRLFLQNHVSTNKILEEEECKYRFPINRQTAFTQMQIFLIITKKLEPQQSLFLRAKYYK